jgi:hypothetical protein
MNAKSDYQSEKQTAQKFVRPINEPIYNSKIIVIELALPKDQGEPKRIFNVFEFKTIADLRAYLNKPSKYAIAKSLGYQVTKPSADQYSEGVVGRLQLYYQDQHCSVTLEFNSAQDFAHYLNKHPVLARAVAFTPNV